MEKINDFLQKNRLYFIVIVIALVCAWAYHDRHRNDRVYNDTDSTVTAIGNRIDGARERANSAKERVTEAQKAVDTATERVTAGAELANEIANGVTECERRIDSAIQRNGRIKNIIDDIKRTAK